jgi:sugar/nucleoside kinase (ribokinase family)
VSKGVFFGLTTVDIFNGVPRHPGPNEKMRADWQAVSAGGPAANAAVAHAALGGSSHLCTVLGNHPIGQLAASDLTEHKVVLHDSIRDPDQLPVLSSILIKSETGERTVVYSNYSGSAGPAGIDYEGLLLNCEVLLLDGFYPGPALELLRLARRKNICTVLDGGSWKDGLDPLLPHIDYAICSSDFYPPQCRAAEDVFSYLAERGIQQSAISRGPEPVLLYDYGAVASFPVPAVDAQDTLGAGDILHGAFCRHISSQTFGDSLQSAIRVAAESCRHGGTRQWIKEIPQAGGL